MTAFTAPSTLFQLGQRQRCTAAVQFQHQLPGIRLDHSVTIPAGEAQVVSLSGAFIDRIEFVPDHARNWNMGRTGVNAAVD